MGVDALPVTQQSSRRISEQVSDLDYSMTGTHLIIRGEIACFGRNISEHDELLQDQMSFELHI